MESQIEIKRETEFYQGFIRLKMSVLNKAPSVVTDVSLDFIFEDNVFRIDRYEPHYELKNSKILLGNISGNTSKSIAVYFDPLMCTKSAEISCQVNFRDAHGSRGSVFMEPKLIIVVCPIINTDHDINVGRLKEFIEKLPNRDSKIYEVQHGFDISKLASIAREVLEKHNVRHVRTLETKDGREWEIWYYGRTKVTKADIVIKVSISSEKHLIELFAATETAEALTGLLAEFGRDLKSSLESRSSGKSNVINVTIRDSVIQKSSLIDLCSMDGACPVNILVEDSVIQHSTLFSEKDKTGDDERLKKEQEKQERLPRQQEDEATKLEETKRRAQEEADRRKNEQEKQQQEYLRRQREEEERKNKEALEIKQREEQKGFREARRNQEAGQVIPDSFKGKVPPKKPENSAGKNKLQIVVILIVIIFSLIVILPIFSDSSREEGNEGEEITETEVVTPVEETAAITELNIGYQPSTHQIAYMTAAEKGWWQSDLAPYGITKINEYQFPTGTPEMQAMLAGDLDVAYVGVAPVITALSQGLDAKIVAPVQINGSSLVLRNELPYRTPQDLKGLKIATYPPGTIQDTLFRNWLKENGLDPEKDVTILGMTPGDAVTAISAKQVDAVFLPHPSPTVVENKNIGRTIVNSGEMEANHACCVLVVSGKLIREHPEIVEQIVKTHIKATEYNQAHVDEAAQIYSKKTTEDLETVRESLKEWDGKWITDPAIIEASIIDYSRVQAELGYIPNSLIQEEIFDTSFYEKAVSNE